MKTEMITTTLKDFLNNYIDENDTVRVLEYVDTDCYKIISSVNDGVIEDTIIASSITDKKSCIYQYADCEIYQIRWSKKCIDIVIIVPENTDTKNSSKKKEKRPDFWEQINNM